MFPKCIDFINDLTVILFYVCVCVCVCVCVVGGRELVCMPGEVRGQLNGVCSPTLSEFWIQTQATRLSWPGPLPFEPLCQSKLAF